MTTTITLIIFISFYLGYLRSKRMKNVDKLYLETWVKHHDYTSRYLGTGLFLFSVMLSGLHWGMASGILIFCILLMTIASLVILLTPLGIVNLRFLLLIFTVSLIFEILFI